MKFYIYKYVSDNSIVYIGQSVNLKKRIAQHKIDKLKDFVGDIYYFECANKTAMNSWEYFLINKYHPKYNVALQDVNINVTLQEPDWILYKEENFSVKNNSENKISNSFGEKKPNNININIFNNIADEQSNNINYHWIGTSVFEEKIILYLLIKSKMTNVPLDNIEGITSEYIHFFNITEGGNIYRTITDIINNSEYLNFIQSHHFVITKKGINELEIFCELDINTLINIATYCCTCKYTFFILDALLQTDNYILSIDELRQFLPESYSVNYNSLYKRVINPSIEEMVKAGFHFQYSPVKTGRKYTHINFKPLGKNL